MDYETNKIITRLEIRFIAKIVKKLFNITTLAIPVLKLLDLLTIKYIGILYYSIEEDDKFEHNVMAELRDEGSTYCIRIRESVYERALKGHRASLGFICHEICHFILIHIFKIGPKKYRGLNGLVYARTLNQSEPKYKSMEWQAKALCGELMISYDDCKNMSLKEIIKATNSSTAQALYFLNVVVKKDKKHE